MSNCDFVKGVCRHCAGHLEFPLDAMGQTVPCPHCGQLTELVAAGPYRKLQRKTLAIAIALCVCGLVPAAILVMSKTRPVGQNRATPIAPVSNAPSTEAHSPGPWQEPRPEVETNDFAVMPYKLETLPGSSLVYVTGTVRNLSRQQRFGVKLAFTLYDKNDMPVGTAADYKSVMEGHGEWHFKALVIVSKSVSARFSSIGEEK